LLNFTPVLIGSFSNFTWTGLPSSFTSKVTSFVDFLYPFGAIVSVNVYVPASNLLTILCGVVSDTHSSTTLPFASLIIKVAPLISFPFVISTLLISTFVLFLVTLPVISPFAVTVLFQDSQLLHFELHYHSCSF